MPIYKLTTPKFDEHSIMVACSCWDAEHSAQLTYFDAPDDWEMTFSYHLSSFGGVLRRIRRAIKYVLGYKCRYGEWDTVLIEAREAKEIIDFLWGFVDSREQAIEKGKAEPVKT